MSILLLGDSHTDIFVNTPGVNRFNTSNCSNPVFTAHRFVNSNDTDLWQPLQQWFKENSNSSNLVICAGEIDIRAHFWRHIPRHYQSKNNILEYVQSAALTFYKKLAQICDEFGVKRIVVWGPTTAGERALYNSEYPFVGSSRTRNQLIHLWNRELYKLSMSDSRISLATAYYNFVELDTYTTSKSYPSHDGVHWGQVNSPIGLAFWKTFIEPCLSGSKICVGENWNHMVADEFDVTENISQGLQKYDTWARTDQLKNNYMPSRSVIINNQSYSWIRADERNHLPDQYSELSLMKV